MKVVNLTCISISKMNSTHMFNFSVLISINKSFSGSSIILKNIGWVLK